jgi:hypothetical protein
MSAAQKKNGVGDVFDFYVQWPKLRGRILALVEEGGLDPEDEEILSWMIHVMDRVGPSDVSRDAR